MNWNYRAMAFVVTCLFLFAAQGAHAASLILNGNMESWSSPTSLNNWSSAGGNGNQLTGQNSPFTDVEPLGNNAAQLSPGNNGYVQNFTAQTGIVQTTLEFKFDSLPINGDVYHWGIDNGSTTAFRLALGANFGKYTANQTGIVDILPLTAGTWYQVFVNADTTSQTISGGIRPFGGPIHHLRTGLFAIHG